MGWGKSYFVKLQKSKDIYNEEHASSTRGVSERQQPGLPRTQYICDRTQQRIIQISHQHHHRPNTPHQPTNYDRVHQQPKVETRQRKRTRGIDDNETRNTPPTPGRQTKNNVVTAKQVHVNDEKKIRGEEAMQQPTQREGKQELGKKRKCNSCGKEEVYYQDKKCFSLEKNKDKWTSW